MQADQAIASEAPTAEALPEDAGEERLAAPSLESEPAFAHEPASAPATEGRSWPPAGTRARLGAARPVSVRLAAMETAWQASLARQRRQRQQQVSVLALGLAGYGLLLALLLT